MLWIRIRNDFGRLDPDPDPSGQRGPQKEKKFINLRHFMFEVVSYVSWTSFLDA
jgi:hypothetical protein